MPGTKPSARPLITAAGMALALSLADGVARASSTAPGDVAAVSPAAAQWRLTGQARLTFFGFDVYDARLWADGDLRRDDYTRAGFALELTYKRDFEGRVIAERSLAEMRRVARISDEQGQRWLGALQRLIPNVARGDRITGVHQNGSVLFLHNGRLLGSIDDAAFAQAFFGIWLSPRTSEPGLRDALLAGAAR